MNDCNDYTLLSGTVIQDRWIILEFIGKGGMGEVYRAHQSNLKRDVAFKIISKEWLDSMEENEEERKIALQRFHNEVLTMAQIRHPNLLQIYDYSSFSAEKDPGAFNFDYIVMEYVPGGTLRSTMSDDGFYPEEYLVKEWLSRYFLPVLDGVHALHEAGIIHRDLKPGNILMDGNTPKITDFGLARSSRLKPVTTSMDIKGTPAYMSPEHFMDLKRTDHRSDIYSLGKILYEVIDGKIGPETLPFKNINLHKAETSFFEKLDQIIRTATAEDKNQRYGSVEEFRDAIIKVINIEDPETKPENSLKLKQIEPASYPKLVKAGIVLSVSLILAIIFWLFFGYNGKSFLGSNANLSTPSDIKLHDPLLSQSAPLIDADFSKSIITGKDDAKLHLIPGGNLLVSSGMAEEPGRTVKINPFYMDETEVTNHQYVEFLNRLISKINVQDGVVKLNAMVLLLLGKVAKGYEPIAFKDGKFAIKDPGYHSHPVVRVTAFGAAEYAKYYGRRLPTAAEWLYASEAKNYPIQAPPATVSQESKSSHMDMMHAQTQTAPAGNKSLSKSPVSVTQSALNRYGIRGLDGNVDEWGIIAPSDTSQISKGDKYGVFPAAVERQPWEAFKDVGFRTALHVSE